MIDVAQIGKEARAMETTKQTRRRSVAKAASGARTGSARRRVDAGARAHATEHAAVTDEERHRMIASIAYFQAERRGFVPGAELDDWLQAEREVDELLRVHASRAC